MFKSNFKFALCKYTSHFSLSLSFFLKIFTEFIQIIHVFFQMCFKHTSCDSTKALNTFQCIFHIINGNHGKLSVKLSFCGVVHLPDWSTSIGESGLASTGGGLLAGCPSCACSAGWSEGALLLLESCQYLQTMYSQSTRYVFDIKCLLVLWKYPCISQFSTS